MQSMKQVVIRKKLYSIIKSLTSVNNENPLPDHDSLLQLANDFGNFFVNKIETIRQNIDSINTNTIPDADLSTDCATKFSSFKPLTEAEVRNLVMQSKPTTCDLDPIPSSLLKTCIDIVLPVLTKMVNLSLETGTVPESWKLALVIPLIKQLGLQLVLPNYRPVSNLPFIAKITERAVIDQEKSHMELNCPLPDCASAYRDGHSTESALIKVQSDILHNMQRQRVTLLVLIDLSAAFDTIDHTILFDTLERKFGISGIALEWHKSYLHGHQQCVNINGTRSCPLNLKYGVPQGSCLGPVLFSQYASTIFDVIKKHLEGAHAYADDHHVYLAFNPNSDVSQQNAIDCMESCLVDVKSWMVQNKLKMKDSKTEFIVIGSRQQLEKVNIDSIKVGDVSVKAVDDVRDLGAYLDKTMSMEKHINSKVGAAYKQLFSLRRIRKYLTQEATETLVHSLIFSHIDYCNALLYDLPQNQTKKLQMVQNMAARLVFKLPKFSHVTPLFIELRWLPVSYRIKFKILLYTFKGIHQLASAYICDMFKVKSGHYKPML